MAKKLCLALGSGGSRGIAHVGFLQALDENGIKPDYIVGCSMGAIVGACYAAGITPKEMKETVDSLKFKDIVDVHFFPFTKKGLLRSVKMRNKITSLLGHTSFEELKIPIACIAVDLVSGEVITLKDGDICEAVSASSSIPTVFRPVEIDGMELVDGGVLERVPVRVAKEEFKPDVIVAVDVLGKLREFKPLTGLLSLLLKVVEVNDCHQTKGYYKKYKPNLLIEPELGDMQEFKVERLDFAYEEGYKAGLKYVKKIKKLIKD